MLAGMLPPPGSQVARPRSPRPPPPAVHLQERDAPRLPLAFPTLYSHSTNKVSRDVFASVMIPRYNGTFVSGTSR